MGSAFADKKVGIFTHALRRVSERFTASFAQPSPAWCWLDLQVVLVAAASSREMWRLMLANVGNLGGVSCNCRFADYFTMNPLNAEFHGFYIHIPHTTCLLNHKN